MLLRSQESVFTPRWLQNMRSIAIPEKLDQNIVLLSAVAVPSSLLIFLIPAC